MSPMREADETAQLHVRDLGRFSCLPCLGLKLRGQFGIQILGVNFSGSVGLWDCMVECQNLKTCYGSDFNVASGLGVHWGCAVSVSCGLGLTVC